MYKICSTLGMPPEEMIQSSRKSRRVFFTRNDDSNRADTDDDHPFQLLPCESIGSNYVPRTLAEIIGVNSGGPRGSRKDQPGHSKWDYLMFLQLVKSCLTFDPLERITPFEALHAGFFRTASELDGAV